MGVIKSNNAPASVSPFSMRDIETQAKAILLRAQQHVDQMIAAAQTEAALQRQKAYDLGFAAGREDGLRRGIEEGKAVGTQTALNEQKPRLEQLVKTLTAAVTEIDSHRAWMESSAASQVVQLAVAIARRVTKLQGSLDPNVLTENLAQAMKLAVHAADVRIAIHPTQKQFLSEKLPALKMQWPKVSHIELIEDAGLAPGGCRIFTAGGEIDADLDRQIDRVASDLLPSREGKPA
ncbi:MAG TPA: FliH/SctL family protein [Tepidisphaeraceae bacterium]|nr:FliH/SctL family protein [Tepidisphaeraceae bacterium]